MKKKVKQFNEEMFDEKVRFTSDLIYWYLYKNTYVYSNNITIQNIMNEFRKFGNLGIDDHVINKALNSLVSYGYVVSTFSNGKLVLLLSNEKYDLVMNKKN